MSRAPTVAHSRPPGVDPDAFRDACTRFSTGVTIATVCAHDQSPHGLTVNSFTAVSLRPPMILICIDYASDTLEHFRSSAFFAVNVLTASQQDLSVRFAKLLAGRFDGVHWYAGTTGAPLLPDVLAVFECRVSQIVEAGDHAILIGEVMRTQWWEGQPLLYFNREYRRFPA